MSPDSPSDPFPADHASAEDARYTVGVFDSGIGGLSVVAALHRRLPSLPVRYIADTAWFPYGDRPAPEVERRARALAEQLLAEGCRLLVVACNTSSSAALEALRERFDVPVVGMEPPLKPAVERSHSGRVAVLVTPATARGERLARLHRAHAGDAAVLTVPMPGLADRVEAGEVDGERVEALLHGALDGIARDGVDQVALGCTHYGFLRPAIEAVLGPEVAVLDAAEAVAQRVEQQLAEHGIAVPAGPAVPVVASATGDGRTFADALERLRRSGAPLPPLRLAQEAAA